MNIFVLFFLYALLAQIKHFVADYLLQNEWMLGKFRSENWVLPLFAHCSIHAVMTFLICAVLIGAPVIVSAYLTFIDFSVHFIMDRLKAAPDLWGRFEALSKKEFMTASRKAKISNWFFWQAVGFDQMIHHWTDLIIIFVALVSL